MPAGVSNNQGGGGRGGLTSGRPSPIYFRTSDAYMLRQERPKTTNVCRPMFGECEEERGEKLSGTAACRIRRAVH